MFSSHSTPSLAAHYKQVEEDLYRCIYDIGCQLDALPIIKRCQYLEAGDDAVFDFIQVLHSTRYINDHVRSISVRSETPDLTDFIHVHLKLLGEKLCSLLGVLTWVDVSLTTEYDIIRLSSCNCHYNTITLRVTQSFGYTSYSQPRLETRSIIARKR